MDDLVWTEGTILTQHHFQALEYNFNRKIESQIKGLGPFNYGFINIEWLASKQDGKSFRLSKLEAIFPSGIYVCCNYSEEWMPSFELELQESRSEIDLCLVYDEKANHIGRLDVESNSLPPGYFYKKVADAYSIRNEKEILFKSSPIYIIEKGAQKKDQDSLYLGRLVRDKAGSYYFNEHVPRPVLDVKSCDAVVSLLDGFLLNIKSKLSLYYSERSLHIDFGLSADKVGQSLFYGVLAQTYEIVDRFTVNGGSPYDLYCLIKERFSAIHLFSQKINYFDLGLEYDHNNIYDSYYLLVLSFDELVDSVVFGSSIIIELNEQQGVLFSEEISSYLETGDYLFFLSVAVASSNSEHIAEFPKMCKISSSAEVDNLIESSTQGLGLIKVKQLPSGINPKLGREYFMLQQEGDHWSNILRDKNISIFCMGEFSNSDVELTLYPKAK